MTRGPSPSSATMAAAAPAAAACRTWEWGSGRRAGSRRAPARLPAHRPAGPVHHPTSPTLTSNVQAPLEWAGERRVRATQRTPRGTSTGGVSGEHASRGRASFKGMGSRLEGGRVERAQGGGTARAGGLGPPPPPPPPVKSIWRFFVKLVSPRKPSLNLTVVFSKNVHVERLF